MSLFEQFPGALARLEAPTSVGGQFSDPAYRFFFITCDDRRDTRRDGVLAVEMSGSAWLPGCSEPLATPRDWPECATTILDGLRLMLT